MPQGIVPSVFPAVAGFTSNKRYDAYKKYLTLADGEGKFVQVSYAGAEFIEVVK